MRMKFVTQDKLYEQTDQIDNKFADNDSHRNQIMYDLANLKNTLVEYTHKKDFYEYQGEIESKIEKLAPWDTVKSLYNEFQRYLPNVEFDDYKKEV